ARAREPGRAAGRRRRPSSRGAVLGRRARRAARPDRRVPRLRVARQGAAARAVDRRVERDPRRPGRLRAVRRQPPPRRDRRPRRRVVPRRRRTVGVDRRRVPDDPPTPRRARADSPRRPGARRGARPDAAGAEGAGGEGAAQRRRVRARRVRRGCRAPARPGVPRVSKAMIIGLDCAEPSLVFDSWLDELPNLRSLVRRGTWGRLRSITPPITVPAWSCMMASRTPGDLGIYGFRNRSDYSYDGLYIANGSAVREPRLWDLLTRLGKDSIVLGVPGTFPVRPLKGVLVSCFLTPSTESDYTYPHALRTEVADVVGEYLFDCTNFRTLDRDDLLNQVYAMTDRRFALADHLLETRPWDLFAMVDMGTDRMHHAFWKDMDPSHRKHDRAGLYQ